MKGGLVSATAFLLCFLVAHVHCSSDDQHETAIAGFFAGSDGSEHTNNWAVLVDSSRFWFNYRHAANVLSLYQSIKRLGIPDSNIVVMLADDHACNSRNPFPGEIYHNRNRALNVYGDQIEVDYRGYEVNAENFIRVLTGRHDESVPRNKRLLSDERSNVLVYMTGHGGDEFLKFQDAEEISSIEIADAIEQMFEKKRYNELLFIADTCQAFSLTKQFYTPNVVAIGSSLKGQNSYSHHSDPDIGVSVVDRMSFYILEFMERVNIDSNLTLHDFFTYFNYDLLHSDPGWTTERYPRPLNKVLITEFFGALTPIEVTDSGYQLTPSKDSKSSTSDSAIEKSKYNSIGNETDKEGPVVVVNTKLTLAAFGALLALVVIASRAI